MIGLNKSILLLWSNCRRIRTRLVKMSLFSITLRQTLINTTKLSIKIINKSLMLKQQLKTRIIKLNKLRKQLTNKKIPFPAIIRMPKTIDNRKVKLKLTLMLPKENRF